MPRAHPPYPQEFKRQMVELLWVAVSCPGNSFNNFSDSGL